MKARHLISVITISAAFGNLNSCKTFMRRNSQLENSRDHNAAHRTDTFYIVGEYDLAKDVIPNRYGGVSVNRFGTMTPLGFDGNPLKMPYDSEGRIKVIRDQHYPLNASQTGIRPIPVVDGDGTSKTVDGSEVRGSEVMDKYLREEMGLKPDDPIFALIAYMHPEMYQGNFGQMVTELLKIENGQTHLGAYIGNGQTRNSPHAYHRKTWGVQVGDRGAGYPANVTIVSLEGVPQKVFNLNAQITLRLLNELNGGVKFPDDYKFDWVRAINLKETLDFYRGWIDPTWVRPGVPGPFQAKLLYDPTYATYCAEHISIALNAALNIPQNETGYTAIWGENGKQLFELAKLKYKTITGQEMPDVPEFTPLWKRDAVASPAAESTFGKSLAWPAETTADLMANFVSQYAAWADVGAPTSAMLTLSFGPISIQRMGIGMKTFYERAKPLIVQMFVHEAFTKTFSGSPDDRNKAFSEYIERSARGFSQAIASGQMQQMWFGADRSSPQIADMIPDIKKALEQVRAQVIAQEKPLTIDAAWENFSKSIQADLAAARAVNVRSSPDDRPPAYAWPGPEKFVQFYFPPAIVHRVINGVRPAHPAIKLRTVATAIDPQDVIRREKDANPTEYNVYQ